MRSGRLARITTGTPLAIILLLLASTVASATWTTIDTNNGQIDAAWGAPTYTDPCGNDGVADPKNEIKNAWYKYDGTSLSFRMETCGTTALSDTTMRAIAGIDCTGDGDFDDPSLGGPEGDRLVVYKFHQDTINLLDGKYGWLADIGAEYVEWVEPNVEWKVDIGMLPPGCRGSINSNLIKWATTNIYSVVNQSKQTYAWSNPMDYGDLPNPDPGAGTCDQYLSRLPCNGPRHGIDAGFAILGAAIDPDTGGLYDFMASQDDTTNTGAADDEDGVAPTKAFAWTAVGGKLDVTVSGGSGYLSCWIDWNNNYSFDDAGDKVIADQPVSPGLQSFSITTSAAVDGAYYARCRISPGTGTGTMGPIYGGEVEDYRWLPQTSALAISRPSNTSPDAQLSWTEVSTADTYNIYRRTTPYLQPGGTPLVNVADSPYSDPVLGGTPDTYFYVMTKQRTVTGNPIESVASNEVGVFEFGLTQGTP